MVDDTTTLSAKVRALLEAYRQGDLDADKAEGQLLSLVYQEGVELLIDVHRSRRLGFPEIVYAPGKTVPQVLEASMALLEHTGRAFVWGVDDALERELTGRFDGCETARSHRLLLLRRDSAGTGRPAGMVGLITAGAADVPFASETRLLLEELGCRVVCAFDMGASGMHRPLIGLKRASRADVLVVFAGMDGVLPTLVASLTDRPVVAVPTPVGYGHGGCGEAALATMLQCCVPGVCVVNIGNTIGAAASALRILNAVQRGQGG